MTDYNDELAMIQSNLDDAVRQAPNVSPARLADLFSRKAEELRRLAAPADYPEQMGQGAPRQNSDNTANAEPAQQPASQQPAQEAQPAQVAEPVQQTEPQPTTQANPQQRRR